MNLLRNGVKSLFLLLFSGLLIYLMLQMGYLDLAALKRAANEGSNWLVWAALVQLVMLFLSVLRFYQLLRANGLATKLSQVTVSSLISIAVGQLLPASQAVTELLRLGILFGWHEPAAKTRLKITALTLVEKYFSYLVMLAAGGTGLFFLAWYTPDIVMNRTLFQALMALAFAVAAGAAIAYSLLYFLQRWAWIESLLSKLRRVAPASLAPLCDKEKLKEFAYPSSTLFIQGGLSLLILFTNSLVFYFCSLAAGMPIPLWAIFSVMPLLGLATFLPMGFAGVGGQQFVAIGFFAIFSFTAQSVVAASLVVNLLIILLQLSLGGVSLALYWPQIRTLYAKEIAPLDQ